MDAAQRAGQRPLRPAPVPADGVEPVDGVLPAGLCEGLLRREQVAVRGARLVPEGFAGRDAGPGRPLERIDAAWPEGEAHSQA